MATGLKFQVQQTIYDNKSMLDEQNFYHQGQGSPSQLTNTLTYILGSYTGRFSLGTMTDGLYGFGVDAQAKEIDDMQFTYPVMTAGRRAARVAKTDYVAGDKPGVGNSVYNIYFEDNSIKRFFIIQSTRGVQAYVTKDLVPEADGTYRAEVLLSSASPADFCPLTELQRGVRWVKVHTAVAESESRTTESTMVAPGSFKNQMGVIRAGHSWAGNSANKTMKINITTEKGTTDVWMDFAMWQFEEEWLEQCESLDWYSRYNRLANGTVPLKDLLTGKVIPTGSGVLEQIQNKTSYSSLNYKAFVNKVGDALFGSRNGRSGTIALHTGTGGKREFHKMIMEAGAETLGLNAFAGVADKFITGSGANLALGGYFDTLYHIDGIIIKVKYNAMFDHGPVAQACEKHPESGLPLESYRMVFIDDNDTEGQANIQRVVQKGRAFLHGVVNGLTPMPKSLQIMGGFQLSNKEAAMAITTDQDKSGYTRLRTSGIQILDASRCFDMQCIAGL